MSLYAGYSSWNETNLTTAQTIGTRFIHNDSDKPITHLSWFRASVGTNRTPVNIRLYDQTNGSIVAQPDVVDDGAIGWQDCPLVTPFTPVEGRDYIVATGWNNGQTRANTSTGTPGAPLTPLAWDGTPPGCYTNSGNTSYPDTTASVYLPCDVVLESGPLPPGDDGSAPTNANITARLLRFFSSDPDVNTQEGDLPWLTKLGVDNLASAVADTLSAAQGAATAATNAFNKFGSLVGGTVASGFDDLKTFVGNTIDAGGAAFNAYVAAWEDFLASFGLFTTNLGNRLSPPAVGTASGWTETDVTTGFGTVKWDVPADAYILTRIDWDTNRSVNVYEGVTYFFDRGWWAPVQDDLVEGYGTLASEKHILRNGGRRMHGVLIVQDPDFEWTLQAFDLPVAA